MLHVPTDYKGQGSFFCRCINDCGLAVEKDLEGFCDKPDPTQNEQPRQKPIEEQSLLEIRMLKCSSPQSMAIGRGSDEGGLTFM